MIVAKQRFNLLANMAQDTPDVQNPIVDCLRTPVFTNAGKPLPGVRSIFLVNEVEKHGQGDIRR